MNKTLLNKNQICELSIIADRIGDDRVFALCAKAHNGDKIACRQLTDAYYAARAARAGVR